MRFLARKSAPAAVIFAVALASQIHAQTTPVVTCASLADQRLPNTTITEAQAVTTGSFMVPGWRSPITGLPPFCRVAGVMAPTSDSHILFEVWLPLQDWNGKFAGVGNSGWAGSVSFSALADQITRGYASASTNTGHEGQPCPTCARFAFEHPEQLVDFAYRSHHETALLGKALVRAFYGRPPEHAYFIGCSSGGYEGLMEAQRFPADYGGIVAGAPANNWTRLMAGDLDATLAMLQDSASYLPPAALGLLYRGVLAACDTLDGVADGVLEDPRLCRFDPAALRCAGNQTPDGCLTSAQVEAARRVYRGVKDPMNGAQLYPGLAPGSEPFWSNRDPAYPFTIPVAHYKWLVFGDSSWSWRTFDLADSADYQAFRNGESRFARLMNATDPDLTAFRQRGGKLLQYHGWGDGLIAPQNSIDYYETVLGFLAGDHRNRGDAVRDVQSFYRLFMVPGAGHCGGGPGTSVFDMQLALERWVEQGIAPDRIIATHSLRGVVDRLRPLCPYPQTAVYRGSGDTNDAGSFICRDPEAGGS